MARLCYGKTRCRGAKGETKKERNKIVLKSVYQAKHPLDWLGAQCHAASHQQEIFLILHLFLSVVSFHHCFYLFARFLFLFIFYFFFFARFLFLFRLFLMCRTRWKKRVRSWKFLSSFHPFFVSLARPSISGVAAGCFDVVAVAFVVVTVAEALELGSTLTVRAEAEIYIAHKVHRRGRSSRSFFFLLLLLRLLLLHLHRHLFFFTLAFGSSFVRSHFKGPAPPTWKSGCIRYRKPVGGYRFAEIKKIVNEFLFLHWCGEFFFFYLGSFRCVFSYIRTSSAILSWNKMAGKVVAKKWGLKKKENNERGDGRRALKSSQGKDYYGRPGIGAL